MRYEVEATIPSGPMPHEQWFWRKRSANGEITCNTGGETYTRHEDAVRAIRTDIEDAARILRIDQATFDRDHAHLLTYHDVTGYDEQGDPIYTERFLYPEATRPESPDA